MPRSDSEVVPPGGDPPIPRARDALVIGGGCYGSYHARQLDRARERGLLELREIVLVDRDPSCAARAEFAGRPGFRFVTADWVDFVSDYMDGTADALRADPDDVFVPTPVGPHLMFEWIARRIAGGGLPVERGEAGPMPATPYSATSPTGTGYLSFATWTCPVTCVEPETCPVTRGPKSWEMDEAVYAFARGQAGAGAPFDDVEVFRCRPFAHGIAAWPVSRMIRAREQVDRVIDAARFSPGDASSRRRTILVATTSSCHGVADRVSVG